MAYNLTLMLMSWAASSFQPFHPSSGTLQSQNLLRPRVVINARVHACMYTQHICKYTYAHTHTIMSCHVMSCHVMSCHVIHSSTHPLIHPSIHSFVRSFQFISFHVIRSCVCSFIRSLRLCSHPFIHSLFLSMLFKLLCSQVFSSSFYFHFISDQVSVHIICFHLVNFMSLTFMYKNYFNYLLMHSLTES